MTVELGHWVDFENIRGFAFFLTVDVISKNWEPWDNT